MLDPRLLYSFDPEIWSQLAGQRPVVIHQLDGYIDAGQVGRTVGDLLLERYGHDVMVSFDIDQLHDYRSRRPMLVFDTSQWKLGMTYQLDLHLCRDRSGRPFLLLRGAEPDMQWSRLAAALNHIVSHVDASHVVTMSGAPMAVPHTRPSRITEHSTDLDNSISNPSMIDRVEVPGSFSAFWEVALGTHHRLAGGYAVHVPHYLAQAQFTQAASAALHRLVDATGLDLDTAELDDSIGANLDEINAEMAGSDEVQEVVRMLEAQYDAADEEGAELPSADELGAEFERFLAEQDGKDQGER